MSTLLLKIMPHGTSINFIGMRKVAFVLTMIIIIGSIVSLATRGLSFGIDFKGGILMEIKTTDGPANLASMRATLNDLNLGEVTLQGLADRDNEVMIRIERQDGGEEAQGAAQVKVKEALGPNVQYMRVESVGPKVGQELVNRGILAISLAVLGIAAYIWFRFEWQYGVGALVSTFHDIISTFGLFSITGMEFNLTTVAAILTIAGYSINDTVVEYDRMRENLRKYKKKSIPELINLSINETLSRTILTGGTVLVAVLALYIFGGEVLRGFSLAMIWGVLLGTYSSVFVAMPMLVYFNLRNISDKEEDAAKAEAAP